MVEASCPRPGRLSLVTFAAAAGVCLLDSLCFLPHPVSTAPLGAPPPPLQDAAADDATVEGDKVSTAPLGAPPPPLQDAAADDATVEGDKALPKQGEQKHQFGLTMAEVRRNYHKRLEAWSERARVYRRNLTLATQDLLKIRRPPAAAGAKAEASSDAPSTPELSPACALADASVKEREAARVEARLEGSAGLHLWLILRDLYVYGSLNPFTLEAMMRQKRSKMKKANDGEAPTDDEVCLALVDSSTRSNKAWDEVAEERGRHQTDYALETAQLYLVPVLVLSVVAYSSEVAVSCRRRKCNKD